MKTLAPISLMCSIALIALTVTACSFASAPSTTLKASPVSSIASTKDEVITMAKYQQVKEGMAIDDVEKILGKGEETNRMEVAGIATIGYIWKNADGTNMTASFQGGKLTSKFQFGLK